MMKTLTTWLRGLLLLGLLLSALALAPREALAQAHEKREGGYVLRSSTVPTRALDAATARAQGIEPAANRAVLNVTVSREGQVAAGGNVRAQVRASTRDLTGRKREIDMRQVVSNDMVSYMGALDFVPRQVLTFEIVATPQPGGAPITLTFEDKL